MGSPRTIGADLACARCGYNLLGLPTSGLCPECATPVELSWRCRLPDGWTRGFTRRLRLGARLVQFGGAFGALSACVCVSPLTRPLILLGLAPWAVAGAGFWMLTAPAPGAPSPARGLARGLLLGCAGAAALGVSRWAVWGLPLFAPAWVTAVAAVVLGMASYCAGVSHAGTACAPLDPSLRDHGNGLIVMTIVLAVVAGLGTTVSLLALHAAAVSGFLAATMVGLGGIGWLAAHYIFFDSLAGALSRRMIPPAGPPAR